MRCYAMAVEQVTEWFKAAVLKLLGASALMMTALGNKSLFTAGSPRQRIGQCGDKNRPVSLSRAAGDTEQGSVAEWFKALVLKTSDGVTRP